MSGKPDKRLQKLQQDRKQCGTQSATHKYLGVPKGEISMSQLEKALKRKGLKPTTRKRLHLAENMSTPTARRKAHAGTETLDVLTALASEYGCVLVGAAVDAA